MYDGFHIVVNVLVLSDETVLLGKRKNGFGHGQWGLPGGHVEHGEGLLDAGLRELREETGLTAGYLDFVGIADVQYDGRAPGYVQVGFLAHDILGEPHVTEPDRCAGWSWCPVQDLPTPVFAGHDRIIDMFLRKRQFHYE